MSNLTVTIIDVGSGDSILLESQDDQGIPHRALIDSNDSTYLQYSYIFLKKHFELQGIQLPGDRPVFDFVLLTHAHADHGQGLKGIMRKFGTRRFWYPKSLEWSSMADLLRYCNRSNLVEFHESIDNTKILPRFGDAVVEVLWPPHGDDGIDTQNENNNSVVLSIRLNEITFILSGDAEERVWNNISQGLPRNISFFKLPHHGSVNGTFDNEDNTPWLDRCSPETRLAISTHIVPHRHPHQEVINMLEQRRFRYFRTDEHYHISVTTDGRAIDVKHSHI